MGRAALFPNRLSNINAVLIGLPYWTPDLFCMSASDAGRRRATAVSQFDARHFDGRPA